MRGSRRFSRRRFLSAAGIGGAGVGAAVVFGCGDDDDPAPTATSPAAVASPSPSQTPSTITPTPVAPNPGERTWTSLRSVDGPSRRRDHALAASPAGAVYLFGGRGADGSLGDLWRYEVEPERWEHLSPAEGPAPRFGHNLAFSSSMNAVLLFGGQQGATFFNDLWAFDVAADSWVEMTPASPPDARYGAGSAFDATGERWFISHGFTGAGRFDDTWQLEGERPRWQERTPAGELPLERCLLRCAWVPAAESILLYAGQSNVMPAHDDLWSFDARAGVWREIAAAVRPAARNLYAAAFDERTNEFLVFGGRNPDAELGDLWAFDPVSETWTERHPAESPGARYGHDMVWLTGDRGIFLFGGSAGQADLGDAWLLS